MATHLKRILIVEDNVDLRNATALILRRRGYEIIEADDGLAALQILEKDPTPWLALITDFSMPEVNGGELISKAESLGIQFCAVIMTSSFTTQDPDIKKLTEKVHIHFVNKPYLSQDLVAILELASRSSVYG